MLKAAAGLIPLSRASCSTNRTARWPRTRHPQLTVGVSRHSRALALHNRYGQGVGSHELPFSKQPSTTEMLSASLRYPPAYRTGAGGLFHGACAATSAALQPVSPQTGVACGKGPRRDSRPSRHRGNCRTLELAAWSAGAAEILGARARLRRLLAVGAPADDGSMVYAHDGVQTHLSHSRIWTFGLARPLSTPPGCGPRESL